VEGHVAVTCRITLNHLCTTAMHLMANYFDHLLSLGSYTLIVAPTEVPPPCQISPPSVQPVAPTGQKT